MKSLLKPLLAAVLLGLPVANLLRAADEAAPAQPAQSTPPSSSDKPQAQRQRTPEQTLQRLSDQLTLTDDQKAKILPILKEQSDQLAALRNDTSIADDDKRDKMRSIMQSTRTQVGALLTPEQTEKYKAMRNGRGDRSGGNPPPPANNPPPPPPPAPTT